MKFFLFSFIIILIFSCSRTDDSSVNECSSGCTTINGKIVRDNNQGVKNITVEFSFKESNFSTRVIARGTTNENGFFEIEGYINSEELGNTTGSFVVSIDENNVPEDYIKKSGTIEATVGFFRGVSTSYGKNIQTIHTRDTIIKYNLILPLKESLTLKVQNFDPSIEGNKIEINSFLKTLENVSDGTFTIFNSVNNKYNQQNFEILTIGAKNFNNELIISKRKNGVIETETIEFFVEAGQSNELTIDF